MKRAIIIAYLAVFAVSVTAGFNSVVSTELDRVIDDFSSEPDVILITIETTREDHIGPCYGYNRTTAPNICDVAEDAVLFENAYSQGSSTTAAVSPLLTGEIPSRVSAEDFNSRLSENVTTIQETMNRNGYRTVSSLTEPLSLDVNQGSFDRSVESSIPNFDEKSIFYWKFYRHRSPHYPYKPPEKYRKWSGSLGYENFSKHQVMSIENVRGDRSHAVRKNMSDETIISLYDGEIRAVDARVGKLIRNLKEQGEYKESMIVITADHGEEFGEHGNFALHAGKPHEELIRVPLIIKYPGNRFSGTRIKERVGTYSIPSTIYDYLGLKNSEPHAGSLNALLGDSEASFNQTFVSVGEPRSNWAYIDKDFKYHLGNVQGVCQDNLSLENEKLYDLGEDPYEQIDVSEEHPERTKKMRRELCDIFIKGIEKRESGVKNLTEVQRERLKDLGYLR